MDKALQAAEKKIAKALKKWATELDLNCELGAEDSEYPWAKFRTSKSAIKLHVGLNHDGYLTEFVTITDGKTS